MKAGVVSFPGTNCDHDIHMIVQSLTGNNAIEIRSSEREMPSQLDLLFVPGGFSYGDYLRCGAMAKVSPVASAIKAYAAKGGPVVGICNGFQILCELGLLPGVLLANKSTKFISRMVSMKVESTQSVATSFLSAGDVFTVPVAHFEGNYFASEDELKALEDNDQVVFRYCDLEGNVRPECQESNPNGSVHAIAGVRNEKGNVVGYMPHPERIFEKGVDPAREGKALSLFTGLLN